MDDDNKENELDELIELFYSSLHKCNLEILESLGKTNIDKRKIIRACTCSWMAHFSKQIAAWIFSSVKDEKQKETIEDLLNTARDHIKDNLLDLKGKFKKIDINYSKNINAH